MIRVIHLRASVEPEIDVLGVDRYVTDAISQTIRRIITNRHGVIGVINLLAGCPSYAGAGQDCSTGGSTGLLSARLLSIPSGRSPLSARRYFQCSGRMVARQRPFLR